MLNWDSRSSSRRGRNRCTRRTLKVSAPSTPGPGDSALYFMLPDAAAGLHRYWHHLPQEERDAHQHQHDSSAAGEEADEAQDSNANVQDADFDASTLFRYAHARRFHLLRCCFYLVRCCIDLFLLLAGRVAACRLSHRLRLPFCRTRGGTQARRQLLVSMTSRCHPHTLRHAHTSSLVGSG